MRLMTHSFLLRLLTSEEKWSIIAIIEKSGLGNVEVAKTESHALYL